MTFLLKIGRFTRCCYFTLDIIKTVIYEQRKWWENSENYENLDDS